MPVALVLGAPSLADAKPLEPITGRLDRPGYTVIALAASGRARSVVARGGRFSVVPPAAKVTLQLRAADGVYAGPIVLQERGVKKAPATLAIVGVRAGAPLGAVKVSSAAGYALARLSKRAWGRWVDTTRRARAKNGVPIGAGNFGRVLSKPAHVSPPGDLDADGIPDALDIDMNGNLVLNDVDRRATAAARASEAPKGSGSMGAFTDLARLGTAFPASLLAQPVNVNASGVSEADINAALVSNGYLNLGASGPNDPFVSGELDCGGLTYCSAGGTGVRLDDFYPFALNPTPFPSCCDADGNGLGSLNVNVRGGTGLSLFLAPHATAEQIRAGDMLMIHATCRPGAAGDPCFGSSQAELTTTLASVFATVPALASYTDALGTHDVPYPLAPGTALPLTTAAGGGTDISVRLTFWRPQRRAVPDEVAAGAGQWIDMGGLIHFAGPFPNVPCPASAYSDVDPSLIASVGGLQGSAGPQSATVFVDSAHDQPANPHNTFSYTLNLSQCLAAAGFAAGVGKGASLVFRALLPPVDGQPADGATSGYAFQPCPPPPAFAIGSCPSTLPLGYVPPAASLRPGAMPAGHALQRQP